MKAMKDPGVKDFSRSSIAEFSYDAAYEVCIVAPKIQTAYKLSF